MSVLKLKVTTARPDSYIEQNFQTAGGNRQIAERIKQYVERVYTGNELAESASAAPQINIVCQGNEVQASGTLTGTSVVATDKVTINGVDFTCVASGATGNQFNVGASDTLTMAALAAAINASVTAKIDGYVTASAAANVVTVTAVAYGLSGNMFTLTSADATIVASGSGFLTGGAEDAGALTLSF
jgi:phage tail sheath gpL-like